MRTRMRVFAAGVLTLSFGSINAAGPGYSIDAHIAATGSSAVLSNACLRLQATIAEPVAGYSTSTDYAMKAGFAAIAQSVNDGIFNNGFEGC